MTDSKPVLRHIIFTAETGEQVHLWVIDHGDRRTKFAASGHITRDGHQTPVEWVLTAPEVARLFEAERAQDPAPQPLGRKPNDARDVAMALAKYWATSKQNPDAVTKRKAVGVVLALWAEHESDSLEESHAPQSIAARIA